MVRAFVPVIRPLVASKSERMVETETATFAQFTQWIGRNTPPQPHPTEGRAGTVQVSARKTISPRCTDTSDAFSGW